ncbi:uncharacterized protein G2W53_029344 [Senna tora]|uniref:Uncharacterized protein n=1 Tax=Senna tora TaxID=362788 RepID=A0A834W9K0_9FABA|nr:uncharacterized protein G2W53_029344 [Senna tora]
MARTKKTVRATSAELDHLQRTENFPLEGDIVDYEVHSSDEDTIKIDNNSDDICQDDAIEDKGSSDDQSTEEGDDDDELDDSTDVSFMITNGHVPYLAPYRKDIKTLPSLEVSGCDNSSILDSFMNNKPFSRVKADNALTTLNVTAWESDEQVMTTMLGAAIARGDFPPSKVRIATKADFSKDWSEWSLPSAVVDVANSLKEELHKCGQWVPCTANKDTKSSKSTYVGWIRYFFGVVDKGRGSLDSSSFNIFLVGRVYIPWPSFRKS